ncbi:hypothetical protein P280DRAFT_532315 [Massarina eburnea CBS 473.64]|uniref:Uncharacterized protein n=1 Tax=Massarina eburnea CBS 473.64 TaxID=1395130 RepID=A0A6A6SEE3_9PLEO|nr:hypothetical protein P280DRAFT_532315 [Massarina eburnea CBS 473.64]
MLELGFPSKIYAYTKAMANPLPSRIPQPSTVTRTSMHRPRTTVKGAFKRTMAQIPDAKSFVKRTWLEWRSILLGKDATDSTEYYYQQQKLDRLSGYKRETFQPLECQDQHDAEALRNFIQEDDDLGAQLPKSPATAKQCATEIILVQPDPKTFGRYVPGYKMPKSHQTYKTSSQHTSTTAKASTTSSSINPRKGVNHSGRSSISSPPPRATKGSRHISATTSPRRNTCRPQWSDTSLSTKNTPNYALQTISSGLKSKRSSTSVSKVYPVKKSSSRNSERILPVPAVRPKLSTRGTSFKANMSTDKGLQHLECTTLTSGLGTKSAKDVSKLDPPVNKAPKYGHHAVRAK